MPLSFTPPRVAVVVGLVACLSACAPVPTTDPVRSPTQMVALYADLKNAHDATRMGELFGGDYVEHSGRNPSGLAALTTNWKQQFAGIPDLRITIDDVIASGDKVVARTTYSGTHTVAFFPGIAPTGRSFSFGTIDIWRVQGGRFVEHWDQVDLAGLQRQLTAKPSP